MTRAIHWFRQDLRISDNPSFSKTAEHDEIFPVYILDNRNPGEYSLGAASRWWLHHSLIELDKELDGKLALFTGDPSEVLTSLIARNGIDAVFWNRCYEPWLMRRDEQIKKSLKDKGVVVQTRNASLLWEPWTILKKDETPYKVFSPFYKKGCLNSAPPRFPLTKPDVKIIKKDKKSLPIANLNLLPKIYWYKDIEKLWQPGELGAQIRLKSFLNHGLSGYKVGRDFPAAKKTSRLSSALRFGELSPNQVWYAAKENTAACTPSEDLAHFLSELGWREFSYYLLYHCQCLPEKNLQQSFDLFPWSSNEEYLNAWKQGQSGIPFVDAGMRELWQTGYIHNRVRMVVASFLVKNLLIDWREGQKWFWDCLLDADLASNSASWQWVAGSGADAAPYFRIFNPVLQGCKFDPEGTYTRKFVPELKVLPNKFLHCPWEAPESVLQEANIKLGVNYPFPLVNLRESRQKALDAYSNIKSK